MTDVVEISWGAQVAVVGVRGAGLREYRVGARSVLDGCPPGAACTAARGDLLIPWPNRITGARYRIHGIHQRLPVTEPETGAAIHGLTRGALWEVQERGHAEVRLGHDLTPQQGYPFALRCSVAYALSPTGLRVRTAASNIGRHAAPYATGAHPYLAAGAGHIDEATLQVPAARYYPTDARRAPGEPEPVTGTPLDLREPAVLGARLIDHCYTDLARDPDGRARVRMHAPDGGAVDLWLGEAYGHVQVFTGDTVPEPERRRRGVAVEPMTAAPDAFNSGDGLCVLAPGETHTAEWGIEP